MTHVLTLLVAFQIKHFVCDYPLQTPYMLHKGGTGKWLLPLLSHAAVHATGTILIVAACTQSISQSVLFGAIDLLAHAIVDRVKASPNWGGKYAPDQPKFWSAPNAHQMVHHLTHYAFIYALLVD